MKLYHDIPVSQGVENALKRARQMVDFCWYPVGHMPAGMIFTTPTGKQYVDTYLPPYRPQKGMIYSSVRKHEKFIGYNVSPETYVTALSNPNSVLYTKPQHGMGRSMFSYYGTVCSSFVSYVLNLPFRLPCSRWPSHPGVQEIAYTAPEVLQLGDIVLNPKAHIAIITDLQRDVHGNVHLITISESTPPQCVATTFTPEQLQGGWLDRGFRIFRYEKIHEVPYTPDPFIPMEGDPYLECPGINTTFMTDFGNKANYMLGEAVEFSVFESGWTEIRITGPETAMLPISEGAARFQPSIPGFYTAVCTDGSSTSQALEFCVTAMDVQTDGRSLTFSGFPAEDQPLGWIVHNELHFLCGSGYFTDAQIAAGSVQLSELEPGSYYVIVLVKNRFGVYKSHHCGFRID